MQRNLIIALLLLIPLISHAASFDCGKAKLTQEKLICSNSDLSKADDALARVYKKALVASTDKEALKKSQLEWLKARLNCSDTNCMLNAYEERINQLTTAQNKKHITLQKYPISWDGKYLLPNQENQNDVVVSLSTPVIVKFLTQSISAKESCLNNYSFTNDSLSELPSNVGSLSDRASYGDSLKQTKLKPISWKEFDKNYKILSIASKSMSFGDGNQVIDLEILAFGDFNHDGLEDMLVLEHSYSEQERLGIGPNAYLAFRYYILTRKINEKVFRVIAVLNYLGNEVQ